MRIKKYILIITAYLFAIFTANADYWKQVENLASPYKNNYWLDVYFLPSNPQYGWVCGFNGLVIRTSNGGNSWSGTQVPGAYHLESIHFVNQSVGYTSGVEGIFKSTDGGANWANITDTSMAYKVWGCYFVTENDGVAVGGGCNDTTQYFWRTTNGGTTWSMYKGMQPNSGLTDAIIYNVNGIGFAVSSGKLWVTNDGGSSWYVYANTEITDDFRRWHEEITKYGSSFLLPYAGNDCAGGANAGGMYFSTNSGSTWNRASTGSPMFGTFLINETTGWACGYNGHIWFTNNAGMSWTKKDCGVKEGNLDDIWFINPSTGWVVGQGIYKLSQDTCKFNLDTLKFDPICFPETDIDTFYMVNHSFDATNATINISGPSATEFKLISPKVNQQVNIPACDSLEVIVSVSPITEGLKFAYLNANINNEYVTNAFLYAFSSKSTAKPSNYTFTIDTAFCNVSTSRNMYWTASYDNEFIDTIRRMGTNSAIKVLPISKLKVGSYNTPVTVQVLAQDTGWTEENFRFELSPCNRDTIVKIRAYGISPIINAADTTIMINCYSENSELIKIPISNTGNYDLDISNVTKSNSKIKLVGFSGSSTLQTKIKKSKADTLVLEFNPKDIINSETCSLTITNNDSTKARGNKNPLTVTVNIVNNYAYLSTDKTDFKLDTICYKDSSIIKFTIKNNSKGVGNYSVSISNSNCSYSITPQMLSPVSFAGNEEKYYLITLKPIIEGDYSFNLKLSNQKCKDTLAINASGTSVRNDYTFTISEINRIVQTDTTESIDCILKSISTGDAILDSIYLKNNSEGLELDYSPKNQFIEKGTEHNLNFKLTTREDKTYIDTLVLLLDGYCDYIYQIPVKIVSVSSKLNLSDYQITFDSVLCSVSTQEKTFSISNTGSAEDIITNIELDDTSNFKLILPSEIPITIEKNTNEVFKVQYTPIDTGYKTAKIRIYTEKMKTEYFEISLSGFYGYTNSIISIEKIDFGKFQYCDTLYTFKLNIENIGNIADTFSVIRKLPIKGVYIDKLGAVIQSNAKEEFAITVKPSELENFGDNIEEIKFTGMPCSDTFKFEYSLYNILMQASINPTEIVFDDLWLEKTGSREITLYNNSNDTIIVESIMLKSINPIFELTNLPQSGKKIKPLDSLKFGISCTPLDTGNISNLIDIKYKIHCMDSILIPIIGYVPDELYVVKFKIGQYTQKPNDIFTVSMVLDTALPEIDIDSVLIKLKYDIFLISPQKASYKGNQLSFTNDFDVFTTKISKPKANDFIKVRGTVLDIESLALLSVPDTTSICIEEVKMYGKKKVLAEYEDGFYQLSGYCKPIGEISKYSYTNLDLNIVKSVICNNNIILNYNANIESPIEITLYNYLGEIALSNQTSINGKGDLRIDIESLESGMYYLNCSRWNKSYLNKQVLIIK